MSRLLGHRPSPAMVVALLALFIAMAGTSYAAIKLPANSVGSKQIKANAVVSSKIKNGSLSVRDFAVGQIPAGPAGPQGAAGPQGPQGAQGPEGPPAVTFVDVRSGITALSSVSVGCPPGEIATGGGGFSSDGTLDDSEPSVNADGLPYAWHVAAVKSDGTPAMVKAFVVCVG